MIAPSRSERLRDACFVLVVWAASRLLVLYAMLIVAPAAPLPSNGHPVTVDWNAFLYMDGSYYAAISGGGYEYAPDGRFHNIAFFPVYPLIVGAVVHVTGAPVAVVETLVSNLAFVAALFAIFAWARERQGVAVARWAVATMCALPLSIYGTLAYTEGLFAFLTTLALRDFESRRFVRAGLWGALASATRATGIALVPAFAIGALTKRNPAALSAALLACCGIAAFALYCGLTFGDPLAFAHVQTAWRGEPFSQWWAWQHLVEIFLGTIGPGFWPYQLAVALIALIWWRTRERLFAWLNVLIPAVLMFVELRVWFESPATLLLVIGGVAAVIAFAPRLGVVATSYALTGAAIILVSGYPVSADRIAYSIVPLTVALALCWDRAPGAGAVTLANFWLRTPADAIRIAQHIWWIR